MKKETKLMKCDYCGNKRKKLIGTPYLADIPAAICKKCYELIDKNEVPDFDSVFNFKGRRS